MGLREITPVSYRVRFMKVSAREEYGLRCLLQLTNLGEREFLTLAQIAGREGISPANAGKVMWLLSKAGLVSSIRGTKGGYMLARPAAEIRLSEIIKVLDEDTVEGHCKSYAGILDTCVHTSDCGIRSVIVNVHEVVERALSSITLAQLVGTEQTVDTTIHQIQGLRPKAETLGGPAR